ncbi:hypothetical protein DIPPA_03876 [Diplonema papillatum]|nr:hypothetical protein DIPPA_03876 [Diplonema papillatum]
MADRSSILEEEDENLEEEAVDGAGDGGEVLEEEDFGNDADAASGGSFNMPPSALVAGDGLPADLPPVELSGLSDPLPAGRSGGGAEMTPRGSMRSGVSGRRKSASSYAPPAAAPLPAADDYNYEDLGDLRDIDFSSLIQYGNDDEITESSDIDIRKLSVGERLYYIGCGMERNKQERLRREREQKIVSELSQVTAKPMITPKARNLPSRGTDFAEQNMLWVRRLEKERKRHIAKKRMEDIAETLQKVEINRRSAALMAGGKLKEKYKGPISGWNKHFARYQTRKNVVPQREVFSPNINTTSATLNRDGMIGERLYSEATRKEDRLRDMITMAALRELVDPGTGQPYFTPFAGDKAGHVRSKSSSRDMDTVVHSLLSKGQESQKKREKATTDETAAKYTFTPRLNRRSKEMAAVKPRKPLYDASKFSKAGVFQQQQQQQQQQQALSQSNTSPAASRAIKLDGLPTYGDSNTAAFRKRNERLLISKQERVHFLKREQDRKELEQCTFTPRICKQSEDILHHGQALSTGMGYAISRSRSLPAGAYPVQSPRLSVPPPGVELYHTPLPGLPMGVPSMHTTLPQPPPAHAWLPEPDAAGIIGAIGEATEPAVSSFEREMLSVLEEWRKLEDF